MDSTPGGSDKVACSEGRKQGALGLLTGYGAGMVVMAAVLKAVASGSSVTSFSGITVGWG